MEAEEHMWENDAVERSCSHNQAKFAATLIWNQCPNALHSKPSADSSRARHLGLVSDCGGVTRGPPYIRVVPIGCEIRAMLDEETKRTDQAATTGLACVVTQ